MTERNDNPYIECPVYETKQLRFRLIEEKDAVDLLECYSDPRSVALFNSDNCLNNFMYETLDEIKQCIDFWILEYKREAYIRFSIVNKLNNKVIGTIEIFAKKEVYEDIGRIGVLRIDLSSAYEVTDIIQEILLMVDNNFFELFKINGIVTKAIPEAIHRVEALRNIGYKGFNNKEIISYDDYYIKTQNEG